MTDKFKFVAPAELEKADDGSYRIRGLATTENVDQQGETLIQKGVDLTPIDKKRGVLNWDHGKGPENTIGFLDGYNRSDRGIFIEGRLFKNHTKAKAVREIMESLGEGDKGRMGLSVEGRVLERDKKNPKIIKKCEITAVALTMNPVNSDTYADLVKSLNTAEDFQFDAIEQIETPVAESSEPTFTVSQVMAIVQKALGVGSGGTQAPDTRTGGAALSSENLEESEDEKKKKVTKKCNLKPMSKEMYKSSLLKVLDQLQVLYPEYSRSTIWEAVKDRLDTKYPLEKALRVMKPGISGKEREHKLYEDARQRDDYEANKDKSRAQLAEIARETSTGAKEKAEIRAQADAAKQVEDRDHVRPNIKS